jgi:hypothetical protein
MTNANNNGNIEKVMAVHKQQKDDILELYTSFINSYDGSADAFENSEPFMNDLFLSDFTFLTEDGPRDLQWYRDFAESFASRPRSSSRVTHIERTGAGLRVTIANVVAGVELDPITYDGTAVVGGDGRYRIRYFEPVRGGAKGNAASHMENVGRMVHLATNSPANMSRLSDEDSGPQGAHKISGGRRSLVTPAPSIE